MSVRIWLKKDGEVEVARLLKTGVLANLKINEHHTSGKKYIKLGVSLTDPTEEIPQIPQAIVERVTFKGKVVLLGDYEYSKTPIGSFHSGNMDTHLLISATGAEWGTPKRWCDVILAAPSIHAAQDTLCRLVFSSPLNAKYSHLSMDKDREWDEPRQLGCFMTLPCFPHK